MVKHNSRLLLYVFGLPVLTLFLTESGLGQTLNNTRISGYKGIWFELNQKFEYGDKYSGGLGTYTAKHIPLAIYSEAVNKTFFVYGGTTLPTEKHLLCMAGAYDHQHHEVSEPVVVHDKEGVNDPHDNPSLLIDSDGYIWVFVSGRGRSRPGFKYRSTAPYSIDSFTQVSSEEMTYPQPWSIPGQGILHFFTKYTGIRELYFETSKNGYEWSEDIKLAGIKKSNDEPGGHYQISNVSDDKVVTFFNRHPGGDVDKRTDLYYLQSRDFGNTWTDIEGRKLSIPLTGVDSKARIIDYQSMAKNVYLKDVNFDKSGNPVCLYLTSGGHEPGPVNDPREWKITRWDGKQWVTSTVCTSDHNYDMGSLYIEKDKWLVIAPTESGPQKHGTGGEIVIRQSTDLGNTWSIITKVNANKDRNYSYVRRPVNAKNPFYYFFADGNADSFSLSHLYFGNSKGTIWQLPYIMKNHHARPYLKFK